MVWDIPLLPLYARAHTDTRGKSWQIQGRKKLIVWSDYVRGRNPIAPFKRTQKQTYLVISKLQPFRRSRALFRMMPLSLPRYTFLSEFMGAGRPGWTRANSSVFFFSRTKNRYRFKKRASLEWREESKLVHLRQKRKPRSRSLQAHVLGMVVLPSGLLLQLSPPTMSGLRQESPELCGAHTERRSFSFSPTLSGCWPVTS